MDAGQIRIVYDGLDADRHEVDMRLFGRSLIGIDKIISDQIIFLTEHRRPRQRERAPLIIRAQPPKEGSAEVFGNLAPAVGALPLVWEFITAGSGDFMWRALSWVLDYHGGRKDAAEAHLAEMGKTIRAQERARSKTEERYLDHLDGWRDGMFDLVKHLHGPAKNVVAPIGVSVERMQIGNQNKKGDEFDEPLAAAIRYAGDAEVGDLEQLVVRVDGYQHHNKTLKIERPDLPGSYMTADIRDPAFDQPPNIYTQAAEQKAQLVVTGKRLFRAERLERIYIFDASQILPDAA